MSRDRIENLPFTTYDLVGYLVPGSVVVLIFFLHNNFFSNSLSSMLEKGNTAFQVIAFLILLILSYVMGHVLSYLSSEVSEKFIVRSLGYPTVYLMGRSYAPLDQAKQKKTAGARIRKNIMDQLYGGGFGWRGPWFTRAIFIFHIVLLPVILGSMLLGFGFYTEPLSPCVVNECKKRFTKIWPSYSNYIKEQNGDWFSLLSYYTLNKYPYVAPKAYNYVVLYGFLRSFLFLGTIVCWLLVFDLMFDCLDFHDHTKYLGGTEWALICFWLFTWIIGMAYCKFYRRYSREIISSFAALNAP
ncbi:hypothetical protein [Kordiimonas marina]|uniref:hypothetical protein n=1 Tax=Kordiimonas marina TaxID=2872312 RepID=UPI001FF3D000|nr:hypothetical protein [Kordiimonas marina]MCJ9428931.1 hypothetical protein [Kordiimonas marina]